jgi:hypothetical protein
MNSIEWRVRDNAGNLLPVQADGMNVHESGALIFANLDANGNAVPSLVVSPLAYQRAWAMGPAQQAEQQQPRPPILTPAAQVDAKEKAARQNKPAAKHTRKA